MSRGRKFNGFHAGTVEQSRQRYHEIGLCYGCAHPFAKCTCEAPEWKQAGGAREEEPMNPLSADRRDLSQLRGAK